MTGPGRPGYVIIPSSMGWLRSMRSVKPEILPIRLLRIVNGVVAAGPVQRQLLRRELQHIEGVAGHHLLATRVVHDDLSHPQHERRLLEQYVVRLSARFVTILRDPD